MFIHVWYFLTLTLTSLLMGTSFAHTLEMPAKMNVDGQLWRTFQHTLYPYFAYVGAPVGDRRDRHHGSFILSRARLIGRLFIWRSPARFVWPSHFSSSGWDLPIRSMPRRPNGQHLRFRRTGVDGVASGNTPHAARFVLHWIGFSALLISLIRMLHCRRCTMDQFRKKEMLKSRGPA